MLSAIAAADSQFEMMLLGVRTLLFLHLFGWLTLLGDSVVIIGATMLSGLFLYVFKKRKAAALGLIAAVVGAGGTNVIMKMIVGRARPSGLIPAVVETSSSFPSTHATLAVAFYGFIAYLFCKRYPKYTALITTLATLLMLAIGFSRLYLGVHFPSDVLAGYVLGGLWLFIGVKIVTLLKRNGIVQ